MFLFLNNFLFAQNFIATYGVGFSSVISFGIETAGPVVYTWQSVAPAPPASGSGVFQGTTASITLPTNVNLIRLEMQPQNLRRIYTLTPQGFFGASSIGSIIQWGAVPWTSFENAFTNTGLGSITASDIPNLTNVTSLKSMFRGCSGLNGPLNINSWNVSNITNMSELFMDPQSFNQAISLWNTGNVTNMSDMFNRAVSFNLNIGNWNTSNVINMSRMFKNAPEFNRPIGNWNTAVVTNMSEMFADEFFSGVAYKFNQNIGAWNTGAVTNMSGMFNGARAFNQNIGGWNTSNVTNMSDMFKRASAFNQNIGAWNTSNVTTMARMFRNDLITAQGYDTPVFFFTTAVAQRLKTGIRPMLQICLVCFLEQKISIECLATGCCIQTLI